MNFLKIAVGIILFPIAYAGTIVFGFASLLTFALYENEQLPIEWWLYKIGYLHNKEQTLGEPIDWPDVVVGILGVGAIVTIVVIIILFALHKIKI